MKKSLLSLVLLAAAPAAHGVEYYELEVYGYQTTSPHELEIENTTSISSDDEPFTANRILRSSFEFNYGINDRWEAAAYLDYTQPVDDAMEFTAFRAHVRTHLYEKDELPVDLGGYFEVEMPRNFRQKDVGFEFRPIIEKDFSRWTIRLNPTVELSHETMDTDDFVVGADPDDDDANSAPAKKGWHVEWGAAASILYAWSENIRPHLDWHAGFTDDSRLLMPAMDFKIVPHFNVTVGYGWGLNAHTEQRIILTRAEYEIYF